MEKPVLSPSRRALLGGAGAVLIGMGLAGCAEAAARPVPMAVRRNPGCGCCEAWTEQMRASGRFIITTEDDANLAAFKSARVYSCFGAVKSSSVVPISTIMPKYITAIRSQR